MLYTTENYQLQRQINLATGKSFINLAPGDAVIIKSRMRLNIGYRFAAVKGLQRKASSGAMLRFEYNIFNAF